MKDEAFYKERAQEARMLADQVRDDDELREGWLRIAQGYDALANSARSSQTRFKSKRLVTLALSFGELSGRSTGAFSATHGLPRDLAETSSSPCAPRVRG